MSRRLRVVGFSGTVQYYSLSLGGKQEIFLTHPRGYQGFSTPSPFAADKVIIHSYEKQSTIFCRGDKDRREVRYTVGRFTVPGRRTCCGTSGDSSSTRDNDCVRIRTGVGVGWCCCRCRVLPLPTAGLLCLGNVPTANATPEENRRYDVAPIPLF